MATVEITPRPNCFSCRGLGLVRGDFVPVPFGSGTTRLPDDYCDCVFDQLSNDDMIALENEDIEIKLALEVQARIERALAAEEEFFSNQVME